jgi:hypothetical protein
MEPRQSLGAHRIPLATGVLIPSEKATFQKLTHRRHRAFRDPHAGPVLVSPAKSKENPIDHDFFRLHGAQVFDHWSAALETSHNHKIGHPDALR